MENECVLESGTDPFSIGSAWPHKTNWWSLNSFSRHCSMVCQYLFGSCYSNCWFHHLVSSSYIQVRSDSKKNIDNWSSKYGRCVIYHLNLDDIELRSGDDSEHDSKSSKSRWSRFYKLMLISHRVVDVLSNPFGMFLNVLLSHPKVDVCTYCIGGNIASWQMDTRCMQSM